MRAPRRPQARHHIEQGGRRPGAPGGGPGLGVLLPEGVHRSRAIPVGGDPPGAVCGGGGRAGVGGVGRQGLGTRGSPPEGGGGPSAPLPRTLAVRLLRPAAPDVAPGVCDGGDVATALPPATAAGGYGEGGHGRRVQVSLVDMVLAELLKNSGVAFN